MTAAVCEETPLDSRDDRRLPVIRGEFSEMPGLRLTRAQFRRLWSLGAEESDRILEHLIRTGFLVETRDGLIGRRADVGR
jgi:hypothetical protein